MRVESVWWARIWIVRVPLGGWVQNSCGKFKEEEERTNPGRKAEGDTKKGLAAGGQNGNTISEGRWGENVVSWGVKSKTTV